MYTLTLMENFESVNFEKLSSKVLASTFVFEDLLETSEVKREILEKITIDKF